MLSIFCFFYLDLVDLGGLFTKILRGGPLHCVHFFVYMLYSNLKLKKKKCQVWNQRAGVQKPLPPLPSFLARPSKSALCEPRTNSHRVPGGVKETENRAVSGRCVGPANRCGLFSLLLLLVFVI